MTGVPANLAPIFQQAAAQFKVPAPVLAGIASVESNFGSNRGPSSAGAVGLMQFEPATARGLGINPFDDRQAIFGAARLLNQYGYQQNPARALGAYNGGPGNPQYAYAQRVIGEAQRVRAALGGGPGPPGIEAPTQAGVAQAGPTFDQAGFDQARARYIAGNFVQQNANPFDMGSKSESPNPLLGPGLLTTKAPNPADYTKAQAALQRASGATLTNHPAVSTDAILAQASADAQGNPEAERLLGLAKAVVGGPYSQAAHSSAFGQSAAQIRRTGTDCSGFVSWLMGPDGLKVWPQALATPDIPHAPGIRTGQGKAITIWNNPLPGNSGHVFISILGQFFQSAGGGTGIQPISPQAAQQMVAGGQYRPLHPKGL